MYDFVRQDDNAVYGNIAVRRHPARLGAVVIVGMIFQGISVRRRPTPVVIFIGSNKIFTFVTMGGVSGFSGVTAVRQRYVLLCIVNILES